MDLPEKAINEFRQIYKEKVGEEIGYEKAKIEAENFLSLYKLIAKPNNNIIKQSELE